MTPHDIVSTLLMSYVKLEVFFFKFGLLEWIKHLDI